MIRFTIEQFRRINFLANITELVEITDNDGTLIGFFVPASLKRDKQPYPPRAVPLDMDELARRSATAKNGKTTREVFEHLKSLTQDPKDLADLQMHIDQLAERDRCDRQ